MNTLLTLLQRQLYVYDWRIEALAVSVPGHGTAIICMVAEIRMIARVMLTDAELANRLADPGPAAAGLAWDLMTMMKDGGVNVDDAICWVLDNMLGCKADDKQ